MIDFLVMDVFKVIDRGIEYHIEEVEEGGYFGEVVSLPACFSEGETLDEMVKNLREVLALYLEVAEEDGLEIPQDLRRSLAAAS